MGCVAARLVVGLGRQDRLCSAQCVRSRPHCALCGGAEGRRSGVQASIEFGAVRAFKITLRAI